MHLPYVNLRETKRPNKKCVLKGMKTLPETRSEIVKSNKAFKRFQTARFENCIFLPFITKDTKVSKTKRCGITFFAKVAGVFRVKVYLPILWSFMIYLPFGRSDNVFGTFLYPILQSCKTVNTYCVGRLYRLKGAY